MRFFSLSGLYIRIQALFLIEKADNPKITRSIFVLN